MGEKMLVEVTLDISGVVRLKAKETILKQCHLADKVVSHGSRW